MIRIRTSDEALYDRLNQEFFRGRLPQFRVKRSKRLDGPLQRFLGLKSLGECRANQRLILLSADLPQRSAETRRTLLHEMCHIDGDLFHGRIFRSRLRMLHRRGENWAGIEIELYKEEEKAATCEKRIDNDSELELLIADTINKAISIKRWPNWISFRRDLTHGGGLSSARLKEIAPWARDYYHHQIVLRQIKRSRKALFNG